MYIIIEIVIQLFYFDFDLETFRLISKWLFNNSYQNNLIALIMNKIRNKVGLNFNVKY